VPQPHFRQQVTAQFERLPAPIANLWRKVDQLHFTIESRIDRMELAHNRIAGRAFGWLRVAHWYV
jgi:hypothetical protein